MYSGLVQVPREFVLLPWILGRGVQSSDRRTRHPGLKAACPEIDVSSCVGSRMGRWSVCLINGQVFFSNHIETRLLPTSNIYKNKIPVVGECSLVLTQSLSMCSIFRTTPKSNNKKGMAGRAW